MTSTYSIGYGKAPMAAQSQRRKETSCAYFLPHIQPTDRILDVGCGPGALTTDLASLVPHGQVIGLDAAPEVIAIATSKVEEIGGCSNCSFQVGDVMSLPFPDDTFDLVHAHQVLIHLPDPVTALKEMRRVCKKGGIVACREASLDDPMFYPDMPGISKTFAIARAIVESNGAKARGGALLIEWAEMAGFEKDRIKESKNTLPRQGGGEGLHLLLDSRAVDLGFATAEELKTLATDWAAFEKIPDAWWCFKCGEIVYYKS